MKSKYTLFKNYFAGPVCVFLLVFFVIGCSQTRVVKYTTTAQILTKLENPQIKDFILHRGEEVWRINYTQMEGNTITGTLVPVDEGYSRRKHQIYSSKKVKLKNAKISMREVHVFVESLAYDFHEGSQIAISINDISEVRLYEKQKDTGNTVLAVIGTITGTIVVLGIIVALTKDSCPFVYSYDGENYNLEGEIFSGAIFKPLERSDHLKLMHLQPDDGIYNIVITNELREVQHINQLKLMVVNAPEGSTVLMDQNGSPHTINQKTTPTSSLDVAELDVSEGIEMVDEVTYAFDNSSYNVNQLNLGFTRPHGSNSMKLVLRARSSFWVDFLWREYSRFYAGDYDTFVAQRNNAPKENLLQWKKDASLPLVVSVKQNGQWNPVESLEHTGPIAYRDLVIPIDLSSIESDHVEIRLSTGYQFWEVDQAYADFSADLPVTTTLIDPFSAIDHNGIDLSQAIADDDDQYVIQTTIGDELELLFEEIVQATGTRNSYFLFSKGYYNHIREFTVIPNPSEIPKNFKDPNFFMEFSRDRYSKLINANAIQ